MERAAHFSLVVPSSTCRQDCSLQLTQLRQIHPEGSEGLPVDVCRAAPAAGTRHFISNNYIKPAICVDSSFMVSCSICRVTVATQLT